MKTKVSDCSWKRSRSQDLIDFDTSDLQATDEIAINGMLYTEEDFIVKPQANDCLKFKALKAGQLFWELSPRESGVIELKIQFIDKDNRKLLHFLSLDIAKSQVVEHFQPIKLLKEALDQLCLKNDAVQQRQNLQEIRAFLTKLMRHEPIREKEVTDFKKHYTSIFRQNSTKQKEPVLGNFDEVIKKLSADLQTKNLKKECKKIEEILNDFKENIKNIGVNYPIAKIVAMTLEDSMRKSYGEYKSASTACTSQKELALAKEKFQKSCKELIATARPTLERDLEWGDYLKNILKSIANTMAYGVTFCQFSSFFPIVKSKTSEYAAETERKLNVILQ